MTKGRYIIIAIFIEYFFLQFDNVGNSDIIKMQKLWPTGFHGVCGVSFKASLYYKIYFMYFPLNYKLEN